MLIAEVLFSQNHARAKGSYDQILTEQAELEKISEDKPWRLLSQAQAKITPTQKKIQSLSRLQRAFCEILLVGDYKFLPRYYDFH